jgi:ATP-binding cassette subfamily F protein 3
VELLRFRDLERHYGARLIFSGASGVLRDGERIGLVGANGAGKSSLLRMLAGVDAPEGGEIVRARDAKLGYLSQAPVEDPQTTLQGVLDAAFARHREAAARVSELEAALADAQGERLDDLLRRYGAARDALERHGGEANERNIRTMLAALDFTPADLARRTGDFSGGQRTRAMLGRLFLEDPDYLLLDEPTNHLDIGMVRWLEDFLRSDARPFIVVSHDRLFLDRVATQIWEIDRERLNVYTPAPKPYTAFVVEKAERLEQERRDYERATEELERQKAVIAELRTHGSHNYSHVRSREKRLAKLDRPQPPPSREKRLGVAVTSARRATNGIAIRAQRVSKAYTAPLFRDLDLEIARGERVAILGPNGSGKTTLLKILAGEIEPDSGWVRVSEGMSLAYFAQHAADEMDLSARAVDAVMDAAPVDEFTARSLLGRLGLGGTDGDKPVEAFSGGERRRIMLARLMAKSADLLLLDEPTNDLDIASQEALESVLSEYEGAMIVVSHDRYFLQRLVDRVVRLHDGSWDVLEGGFAAYERVEAGEPLPRPAPKPQARKEAPADPKARALELKRALAAAEREVAALDARRAELQLEFADPATYDDRERVEALRVELEELERRSQAALAAWESALEAVELQESPEEMPR